MTTRTPTRFTPEQLALHDEVALLREEVKQLRKELRREILNQNGKDLPKADKVLSPEVKEAIRRDPRKQERIAQVYGISQSYVSKIKRGVY